MYPVFFKIPFFGGITIYSYGVMVATAFVVAILWVTYESKRLGQNPAQEMDLAFYVILSAIIGSRLLHVAISERAAFMQDPLMLFKIWRGGLVFYGGLIGALIVSAWYIRRHRMPLMLTLDIFAPAIAIGHAIGRIGCFLAGCCHGRVAGHEAWYTLVFPMDAHSFAPAGVALYPTQLMEVLGETLIFLILFTLRRYKRFDGQVFAVYAMLYAILRSTIEVFRGDVERGFVIEPWISTSQFVSIFVFLIGLGIYLRLSSKQKKMIGGK